MFFFLVSLSFLSPLFLLVYHLLSCVLKRSKAVLCQHGGQQISKALMPRLIYLLSRVTYLLNIPSSLLLVAVFTSQEKKPYNMTVNRDEALISLSTLYLTRLLHHYRPWLCTAVWYWSKSKSKNEIIYRELYKKNGKGWGLRNAHTHNQSTLIWYLIILCPLHIKKPCCSA